MLGKWTGGGWGGICLHTHSLCDRMSSHTADTLIHCASGSLLKNSKVKVGVWVLVLLQLLSARSSLCLCIQYEQIYTHECTSICACTNHETHSYILFSDLLSGLPDVSHACIGRTDPALLKKVTLTDLLTYFTDGTRQQRWHQLGSLAGRQRHRLKELLKLFFISNSWVWLRYMNTAPSSALCWRSLNMAR